MYCTIHAFDLNYCILRNAPCLHKTTHCFAMGSHAPAPVWQHHCIRNFHIWASFGKFRGHKVKIEITAGWKRRRTPSLAPDIVFGHRLVLSLLPLQQEVGGGKFLQPHRPFRPQLIYCNFSDHTQRSNPLTFWFHFYRWSHKKEENRAGQEKQRALQAAWLHGRWPGHIFFSFHLLSFVPL